MFNELVNEVISLIESRESRERSRTEKEQSSFQYSVEYILKDLWLASKSVPVRETIMHKRSGHYSDNPRYRDPKLTYRPTMAAFEGLLNLNFIEITHEPEFNLQTKRGTATRFIARDELLDRFSQLDGHPAISLTPDFDSETIILRNSIDGRKELIDYEDTASTEKWRENLRIINKTFSKHWVDLYVKDTEYSGIADRINSSNEKDPIDLSKRFLVRIFTNGSFKEGGRFYRGWWQNVPSEYRRFITIDTKKTKEYDYSQLNPNMIYAAYNLELGSEDAYDRVLDGEHRDTVKQAFNAMIQASTALTSKPENIDLDPLGMSWRDLRQAVLEAHKPIQHLFFTGLGNQLQFEDSSIAESIMLQFAAIDAPALPIHDSFIMHHGYASELEENMRRGFYERFGRDINVKHEMVEEIINYEEDDIELKSLTFDEIIEGDKERTQWTERSDLWFKTVNP